MMEGFETSQSNPSDGLPPGHMFLVDLHPNGTTTWAVKVKYVSVLGDVLIQITTPTLSDISAKPGPPNKPIIPSLLPCALMTTAGKH